MANQRNLPPRPEVTVVVHDAADFVPDAGSSYVYAKSYEPRSLVFAARAALGATTNPVEIVEYSTSTFRVQSGQNATVSLRNSVAIDSFSAHLGTQVYLDITGLPHHVWAPILRGLLRRGTDTRVTYVEPADYVFSGAPTEGAIFDLSQEIGGIAPLPGFARLTDPEPDDPVVFVVLLGFEGTRFAYMLEQLQLPIDSVVPIVGVPGFRPEYPFYAYQGNRAPLVATNAWTRVEYCTANSPFSLFRMLTKLSDGGTNYLYVGMTGTKPHSLGAVLYAIQHPKGSELIYDYPVRSPKRTVGAARQLVYFVSDFLKAGAT